MLSVGTIIKTGDLLPAEQTRDWQYEALAVKLEHTYGVVIDHSDSHGVCYKVHHGDRTAWYDPKELVLVLDILERGRAILDVASRWASRWV